MTQSKYTLFVEDFPQQGQHLFFNTRTQALIAVDEELKACVQGLPSLCIGKRTADALATLVKMGFVVQNEAEDSRCIEDYFRDLKSNGSLVQATVLTTYACNFACPYCVEEGVKAAIHMDEETAGRCVSYICERVQEHRPERLFVTFYGGEPLLNIKAIRIVAGGLNQYCKVHSLPFSFGITTNGALLTPEVVDELKTYGLKGVKVTIDGFREQHNRKRPFANGKGSFDIIVENVYQAVEKIDVDVGGNFDEENIESFAPLLDYLKERGLDKKLHAVRFKPISGIPQDREGIAGSMEMDCVYSEPSTAKHMLWLRRLALEKGFRTDPGVGVNACSMTANSAIFTIDPLGKIFKCPALVGHSEFEAGSITTGENPADGTAEDLWKRCLDCRYLPLCGEGCQLGAYLRFGDRYRLNCQKEYVEYMVRENLKLNYLHRKSG